MHTFLKSGQIAQNSNLSTRFAIRRCFWYKASNSLQGAVPEKKSFSFCLASSHVVICFNSCELGCLTQNQPFSNSSLSLRIKGSQLDSSPVGMRSGLVKTPIVLFPAGSYCFVRRWAPWFSKSANGMCQKQSITNNILSQATVNKIMQLGFLMYVVTKLWTRAISLPSPDPLA